MKKIFLFLFMIFAIPCAFFVSACGGNGKIVNVQISAVNEELNFDKEEQRLSVEYDKLSSFELSERDFSVKLEYENSKTKTLEAKDFALSLSVPVEEMEPDNTYELQFSFVGKEESFASIDFYVCSAVVPVVTYQDNMEFTYCEEEIDIIEQLDLLQQGKSVSTLIGEGAISVASSSTTKATLFNPNGYKVILKLVKGFVWSDGSKDDIVISWRINRRRINIPDFEAEKVYDYEIVDGEIVGKEQSFEVDFKEHQDKIRLSGTISATDASEYGNYCWISVREFYTYKYVLYDEKTETEYPTGYHARWQIDKKEIDVPTLKTYDFNFAKPYVDVLGEGNANLQDFDERFVELDKTNSVTKAFGTGEGKVRFSIKKSLTGNFRFADVDSKNVEVNEGYVDNNYNIAKGVFSPQTEIDSSKLQLNTVYFKDLTPNALNLVKETAYTPLNWTEEAWAYLKEQGFVNDNIGEFFSFRWKSDADQKLNAGFYENRVLEYLHYGDCYEPYELVVDINVEKYVYEIDSQDAMEIGFANHIYTYSTTSAPISIKQTFLKTLNAYEEMFGTVYYVLSYRKSLGSTPTNYKLTTEQFAATNISDYIINAGYYTLGVELVSDENYLVSVNGETATEEDSIAYGFRIEQFVADLQFAELENNLQSAGFYETNMLDFYYKEGQNVALNLKSWEEKDENSKRMLRLLKLQSGYEEASSLADACTKVTTYFKTTLEEEWSEATNSTSIGYYKNVYEFSSISENVQINNLEIEWQIHTNVLNIGIEDIVWEDYQNQTYSATKKVGPKIASMPDNIIKTSYSHYIYDGTMGDTPVDAEDTNLYATKFSILIPNDGSVTVSCPSGMFVESVEGNCKIYTYLTAKYWHIHAYYLTPENLYFTLVEDYFEYDGQDKQVELHFASNLNRVMTEKLMEFFGNLELTGKTNEKVPATYQATVVLPLADLDSNFNYDFEKFDESEYYTYDPATDTITVILTWQIARA